MTSLSVWRRCGQVGTLVGLISLAGCNSPFTPYTLSRVDLTVEPPSEVSPGVYAIAGETNLPDNTQLAVAAVRYLRPARPIADPVKPATTYSILAYAPVTVEDGQWQTELNLWQVNSAGEYREAWQMDQESLDLAITPEPSVQFFVTLATESPSVSLEEQLQQAQLEVTEAFIHSTLDGERFLQARQALALALPDRRTTPPKLRPEMANGGWGERYLLVEEPPLPYTLERPQERQTNAPPDLGSWLY